MKKIGMIGVGNMGGATSRSRGAATQQDGWRERLRLRCDDTGAPLPGERLARRA